MKITMLTYLTIIFQIINCLPNSDARVARVDSRVSL